MGEIADSLISGEFDCITGEYLGEEVGYPRTHAYELTVIPRTIGMVTRMWLSKNARL